jgi:hypothetical protein
MAEVDRPSWCESLDCLCLTSFGERFCWGRMPEAIPDTENVEPGDGVVLSNTHNYCTLAAVGSGEIDTYEINDADAWYLMQGLAAVRKDIRDNELYTPPGKGDTYDLGGSK